MSNEPGRARRGLLLVISSPSGAGKTSLSRRLVADHPDLALSISFTTRSPRPGEEDGREYRFVEAAEFEAMVGGGDFLEWAEVHDHRYGSPKAPVMAGAGGRQGRAVRHRLAGRARHRRQRAGRHRAGLHPAAVHDRPGAAAARRAQDAEAVIARRLGRAKGEIAKWIDYDYVILNDDFDAAYAELAAIYRVERLKRARNPWIELVVKRLMDEPI